jgi:hypothetical protein
MTEHEAHKLRKSDKPRSIRGDTVRNHTLGLTLCGENLSELLIQNWRSVRGLPMIARSPCKDLFRESSVNPKDQDF